MCFKVQSPTSGRFISFNTERAAREEAQELANSDGHACFVWELIEKIMPEPKPEPKPEPVLLTVEELQTYMQVRGLYGLTDSIVWAMLGRFPYPGALPMPPGFKL